MCTMDSRSWQRGGFSQKARPGPEGRPSRVKGMEARCQVLVPSFLWLGFPRKYQVLAPQELCFLVEFSTPCSCPCPPSRAAAS